MIWPESEKQPTRPGKELTVTIRVRNTGDPEKDYRTMVFALTEVLDTVRGKLELMSPETRYTPS